MVIADWKLLYALLLLAIPHIISIHLLSVIGKVMLTVAGCWLVKEWIKDFRERK